MGGGHSPFKHFSLQFMRSSYNLMNDHLTLNRLGQVAKVVRIIYMIARGTLDENIWDQLQNKHQVVGATVGKYFLYVGAV